MLISGSHEDTSMHFLLNCPTFHGIGKSHLIALFKLPLLIPAEIVHIDNRHKNWSLLYDVLQVKYSACAVLIEYMKTFISNKWETAMTTEPVKQAKKEYIEGHFSSACISKSSAHQSFKPHTVN